MVVHEGVVYQVNSLLRLAGSVTMMKVTDLLWCVDVDALDRDRVDRADYQYPLLIVGNVVLDGAHRLAKAYKHGVELVPVCLLVLPLWGEGS